MKIIYIEWNDAQSQDSWIDTLEVRPELAIIKSVGILIHETEDILTIALNNDTTNDKYSCIMHIPKGWVKAKKIIKTKLT
jgi:hypothetical protein